MIGDILNAILQEIKAFLLQQNENFVGTVILETDYRSDRVETYPMPLVILDMMDAPEASQYIGGVTRMDWVFGLNSYHYEPDGYVETGESSAPKLLDIIDKIRQHFVLGFWVVPARSDDSQPMAMDDLKANYAFKFTLSGLVRAPQLDESGLIMGWRITLDSVSVDDGTDWILFNQGPLEHVVQTPPDDN